MGFYDDIDNQLMNNVCDSLDVLKLRFELLQKERDAAVEDIRMLGRMGVGICHLCTHFNHGEGHVQCISCPKMDNFIWRGVAKEENK